jgi:hypothetical protein
MRWWPAVVTVVLVVMEATTAKAASTAAETNCSIAGVRPCRDGRGCALAEWLCDGHADCLDGSDEEECDDIEEHDENVRTSWSQQRQQRRACHPTKQFACHRDNLCSKYYGYRDTSLLDTCYSSISMPVPRAWYCDGIDDCASGEDENECSQEPSEEHLDEAKRPDGNGRL